MKQTKFLGDSSHSPGSTLDPLTQGLFILNCQGCSPALLIANNMACIPDYLISDEVDPPMMITPVSPKPGLLLTKCSWCHKPIWVKEICSLGNWCDNDCKQEYLSCYD